MSNHQGNTIENPNATTDTCRWGLLTLQSVRVCILSLNMYGFHLGLCVIGVLTRLLSALVLVPKGLNAWNTCSQEQQLWTREWGLGVCSGSGETRYTRLHRCCVHLKGGAETNGNVKSQLDSFELWKIDVILPV